MKSLRKAAKELAAAGIDEAGRGALAGPVFAAAVILRGVEEGLKDSKALSPKKREALALAIKARHIYSVGEASAQEIDSLNIHHASLLAMRRAVEKLNLKEGALLLVDGSFVIPHLQAPMRQKALVKGDSRSPSIMAASIIAKTERDRRLKALHGQYPVYGFLAHKGYPTKAHKAALRKCGPCPEHRRSFAPVRQSEQEEQIQLVNPP